MTTYVTITNHGPAVVAVLRGVRDQTNPPELFKLEPSESRKAHVWANGGEITIEEILEGKTAE